LGDRSIVDKQCSFTLNSLEDIDLAQKGSNVELKVDTGMHRNGVAMSELKKALKNIQQKELHLLGVMTHNRSADELSSELFWQQKNFEKVLEITLSYGFNNIFHHSFNSATSLRLPCKHQEMIRLGIGAYGYSELPHVYETLELKPVLSLWAKKISTRKLKKGERIGYGGQFVAPKEMLVSTYDLGYGDGWMRSNTLKPFQTTEKLAFLGRVSMDYIVLEGDKEEVCIFNNALEAGKQLKTISYEIVTQLNPNLNAIVI
jgi:alanine racemase